MKKITVVLRIYLYEFMQILAIRALIHIYNWLQDNINIVFMLPAECPAFPVPS